LEFKNHSDPPTMARTMQATMTRGRLLFMAEKDRGLLQITGGVHPPCEVTLPGQ
jgi:hypothetical protein